MEKTKAVAEFGSIIELVTYFSTEAKCAEYLAIKRWGSNPTCVKCGHSKVYELKGKTKRYKCAKCREQYSIRVGTIFEDSKISLQKWFVAIYLITAHKKGISSLQLSRDLSVTQKTAWFMLHRVRYALGMEPTEQLDNVVEVDETFVGGEEGNKHYTKRDRHNIGGRGKAAVVGMVERGGTLVAKAVPNRTAETLTPLLSNTVKAGSTIHTDEWKGYNRLARVYDHQMVKHGIGEYVRGAVHTNTIEGFWSLLQRSIIGVYHFTSVKHLQKYVDTAVFRYNTRGMSDCGRFGMMLENSAGRLTYKTLIND